MTGKNEFLPIAIVGLACRLPGARNLEEFWDLLMRGGSDLGELPRERFDRDLIFDPERGVRAKSYSSIGGVCPQVPFDSSRCPVPREWITEVDEAHLTLCDVAADACRSGGLDPFQLPHRRAGVYVGHTRGSSRSADLVYATLVESTAQYLRELEPFRHLSKPELDRLIQEVVDRVRAENPKRNSDGGPELGASVAAGLISLAFGLDGPYCSLNAACASSLQALALGVQALQLGQIDMAIAGGASFCKADSLVLFSQARSVTDTGSRPFDADADGLVTSEGFVIVIAKTLERALADGNQIFGVIRGMGVSSDGRGKSLWAPRKEGQIEAIRRAYVGDVRMEDVQYVEAHATSTQVGDATEVTALAEAMQSAFPSGKRIPLGSVKANVGHTLETAGMAGLVKAILGMQHGVVPRQINLRTLNPKIAWEEIPFFVPLENWTWDRPADGTPRRAAVNAFGIGGLNVHVVVDEFIPERASKCVEQWQSNVEGRLERERRRHEPIAVVGWGAVLPGARTWEHLWEVLHSGQPQFCPIPADRWDPQVAYAPGSRSPWKSPTQYAACITDYAYDWKRHKVPPKQVAAADPLQFMFLDAVDQALAMSGYHSKAFDRKRTGVLVGTIFGGEFTDQLSMGLRLPDFERTLTRVLLQRGYPSDAIADLARQFGDLLLQRMPALTDETGSFTTSTLASRITKTFDLMGGAAAIDGNIPSALVALSACINQLRSGSVDMMVCAAGQRALDLPTLEVLSLSGTLAHGIPTAPLDVEAQGFLPGEGVGVLLLKRLSDAERDGDTIHALLHGISAARSDSLEESVAHSARRCLEQASIRPADVTAVELGCAGYPPHDQEELAGLVRVYREQREAPLVIGTTAGQMGFLSGGSAMASTLKAVLELHEREVAPNVGFQHAAPHVRKHQDVVSIDRVAQAIPLANPDGRMFAAVSSYGKWHVAYHLLIERPARIALPRPHAPSRKGNRRNSVGPTASSPPSEVTVPAAPPEIHRWQASSLEQLRWATENGTMERVAGAFTLNQHRLAIVAATAEELTEKCQLFWKCRERGTAPSQLADRGIFYGEPRTTRPKIAFLFSGQGSQYAGMLQSLVQQSPMAAAILRGLNADLEQLGYPAFETFAWDDTSPLGSDVWLTQLSLLVADTLLDRCLETLGVRPDRVAGHSYGEFAALIAAQAWSFSEAARATRVRCQSVLEGATSDGAMLAASLSPEQARYWLESAADSLFISHENAPRQVVISGKRRAVGQLKQRLRAEGIEAREIPVPRPFHTPLMTGAQSPFADGLRDVTLEPPRVPLLSSVTNRYLSDPIEIRERFVEQLVTPVRYRSLVERLASEGVEVFIEVGPRQILTRLHHAILEQSGVVALSADHPRQGGIRQLLAAQAGVEALGGEVIPRKDSLPSSAEPAFASSVAEVRNETVMSLHEPAANEPANTASTRPESGAPRQPAPPPAVSMHQPRRETRSVSTDGDGEPLPADGPPRMESKRDGSSLAERGTEDSLRTMARIAVTGSPRDRGRALGQLRRQEIRRLLHRYVVTPENQLVNPRALREAIDHRDIYFDSDALEELHGIAEAAGVNVEALIAHNLQFYPDISAGCSQFAVTASANSGTMLQGANEDLPLGLVLRGCLTRHVQVTHPSDGISHVTFPMAGQVGALSGINRSGVAVTSAMLLDLPRQWERGPGRLHGLIVRDILQRAHDLEEALEIARQQPGVGGWRLCLTHHGTDELAVVEYDGQSYQVRRSLPRVLAANHAQLLAPRVETPRHSIHRQARLGELLAETQAGSPVTEKRVREALRDQFDRQRERVVRFPTMNTVRRVDNQISLVFQPGSGLIWVNPFGAMTSEAEPYGDHYESVRLDDLWNLAPMATPLPTTPVRQVTDCTKQSRSEWKITAEQFLERARSVDGQPPLGRPEDVCRRFVMRMLEMPLPDSHSNPEVWRGSAIILGDNPLGQALQGRLKKAGITAHVIPTADDPSLPIDQLESIGKQGPAPHLFLVTPHDSNAITNVDALSWSERRQHGVRTPYLFTQRWYQQLLALESVSQATVTICGRLGGAFGFSGGVQGVEGGALCGLAKALWIEVGRGVSGGIPIKALDVAPNLAPEVIADHICRELESGTLDVEVSLDSKGTRHVVRPVLQPADSLPARELTAELHSEIPAEIPAGGNWVITGGARGVTAVVARELGHLTGAKLHLVGSSPLPRIEPAWRTLDESGLRNLRTQVMKEAVARKQVPADAWSAVEKGIEIDKNLREFEQLGLSVTYHACDVGRREQLEQTLDQIRAMDGPITGIVHGAGYERACRFDRKAAELVDRTISAKVDAAAHLMDLTRQDPLRAFIAFGSISGRFGGNGQTDYCLANDMLAKLIHWYRETRPDCPAALFHWHSWDEVGMAVRPESMHIKKLFQFQYMPTREGVRHLLDELRMGLPEGEVLITDWKYYKRFFPDSDLPLATTISSASSSSAASSTSSSKPASSPPWNPQSSSPPAAPVRVASSSSNGTDPLSQGTLVAHRHVLRVEPADPSPDVGGTWRPAGPSVVLGDNTDARSLAAEVVRRGGVVHRLSLAQPASELLQELDRLSAAGPLPHLFLLGGRDAAARQPHATSLHERITSTYLVAQKWCQQFAQGDHLRRPVSLVALTALGGDFGFVHPADAPEGGALAGCLKSVFVEWRRQKRDAWWVKVLDAPTSEPTEPLAKLVLDELTRDRNEVEVAFQGGRRFLVRAQYQPTVPQASSTSSRPEVPAVPAGIRPGGAWILTGGARGITAVIAHHLGKQHGVHLHLVGRHPAPSRDRALSNWSEEQLREHKRRLTRAALAEGTSPTRQWQAFCTELEINRNLEQLEGDGLTAHYHACDLSDSRAVTRMVGEVRRISGPVDGIVHGAGVRIPSRFEQVSAEALQATLAAKGSGLLHLLEATRQDPLGWFIGFGSVGGRFGTNGGTLYALGNEMVAKLTGWMRRERPECHSVCFHWHGWDEVGMMMGGASFGAQGVLKMRLMPPSEGIQHLENELRLGAPESEILLTDGELHRLHHPEGLVRGTPRGDAASQAVPGNGSPASPEHGVRESAGNEEGEIAGPGSELVVAAKRSRPVVEQLSVTSQNDWIAECHYDPVHDPFLTQHRFRDRPLLPFVMAIETLAEAAAQLAAPRQVVGLDDVQILSGFRFFDDHPQTARVKIQRTGNELLAQLVADFHNRAGKLVQPDRVYAQAQLRLADEGLPMDAPNPGPVPPLNQVLYPAEREEVLFHGPVFRQLKEIRCESWGGWARVTSPDLSEVAGHRGKVGWIHSPAVLDACLFACGIYPWLYYDKMISLPHSVQRLTFGPLPKAGEDCLLRFEYLGREDRYCGFDFTLFGEDRRPLLQAQRFRAVVISDPVATREK